MHCDQEGITPVNMRRPGQRTHRLGLSSIPSDGSNSRVDVVGLRWQCRRFKTIGNRVSLGDEALNDNDTVESCRSDLTEAAEVLLCPQVT